MRNPQVENSIYLATNFQAGPHNIGEYRCRIRLGAKEEEAAANLIIIGE